MFPASWGITPATKETLDEGAQAPSLQHSDAELADYMGRHSTVPPASYTFDDGCEPASSGKKR